MALRDGRPGLRLHHAPLRRGSQAQHGLAHQYCRLAVGLAHGGARHRHPAPERHDLVRSGAGSRQLRRRGQATAGQHGAGAGLQEGRALSRGRRTRRPKDRVGDSPGDL